MFTGERVNLRVQKPEDADFIVKYQNDEDVMNNYFMSANMPPVKEFVTRWYERAMENRNGFTFAIETKDGQYIGGCHTMFMNWKDGTTYFAVYIGHPDYRSKGYGTEAMNLFLNFLFNEVGLRIVKLNVFSFNKRAIRCYEKCGFQLRGINKKELYRGGEYYDNYAMSITKDAFNRRNSTCTAEI